MRPDRDVRQRPGEHRQLRRDLARNVEEIRLDERGDVLAHEELAQIGVDALGVQVHHFRARDVHAGAPGHPGLDGHVGQVLFLDLGGRLDLDHREPRTLALQDVHGHEHALGKERRLIDPLDAARQRVRGRLDLLPVLVVGEVDQLAAGRVAARQLAYFAPLVHDELGRGVGHELRGVGLVHLPPELLVALEPRGEAGLGEPPHGGVGECRHATNLPGGCDIGLGGAVVILRGPNKPPLAGGSRT